MNKSRWIKLTGLCVVAAVALSIPAVSSMAERQGRGRAKRGKKKRSLTRHEIHAKQMVHLTKAMRAVDGAIVAVEGDRKEEALASLRKARKLLGAFRKRLKKQATAPSRFVNAKCPIMPGSRLNPKKVTAALTRKFKGKTVGFCCAGCPGAWDRLSDAGKESKLQKVLRPKHKKRRR